MTSKQRNIIIAGLCAVVLLMAVGYAAFSSQLNINGTAETTSKWNILITNVTSKEVVGSASNKEEPTWDALTATFSTNLVSPGDSITYDITVENQGNLDAVLSKITLSDPNNDAIIFTTSGLTEGDTLTAGGSSILSVKVEFDSKVTTQPTNLIGTLSVTLDYEQKVGAETPSISTFNLKGVDVELVTENDGLYADDTEEGRYIYKGADPNNYIELAGETYRVVSSEPDGTLKLIRYDKVGNFVFDVGYAISIEGVTNANTNEGTRYSSASTDYCHRSPATAYYGCNVWGSKTTMLDVDGNNITVMPKMATEQTTYNLPDAESYINTYLNTTFLSSLDASIQNKIVDHTYNVGMIARNANQTLAMDVTQEKKYKWTGKVGLISATDYVKTSLDENCDTVYNAYANLSACKNNNYLFKSERQWTMTPYSSSTQDSAMVYFVDSYVGYVYGIATNNQYAVYPVFYLESDITLTGTGSADDKFKISN